jgi:ribonuclease P protein component
LLIKKYSFPKKNRVFRKHSIADLFEGKNSFLVFPFKVIYSFVDVSDSPLKVLITIPRNKQKKATDRNRIKRQTKESWRLQCHSLIEAVENTQNTLMVALIYVHNKQLNYSEINKSLEKTFSKLIQIISSRQ